MMMETSMDCSELKDDLIDVLYDEAAPAVVLRVKTHAESCGPCREEIAAFTEVRKHLADWRSPSRTIDAPARRRLPSALRMAAAAAVAVGAMAASGARAHLERGSLQLGWGSEPSQAFQAALAAAEARHSREIEALRATLAVPRDRVDQEEVVQRVAQMIRDSESRQRQALNTTFADFVATTERRRRLDLARVGAGLAYLDGKNGQQVARTAELMGYLIQASDKR